MTEEKKKKKQSKSKCNQSLTDVEPSAQRHFRLSAIHIGVVSLPASVIMHQQSNKTATCVCGRR